LIHNWLPSGMNSIRVLGATDCQESQSEGDETGERISGG
jgi:hypothetical protein